MAAPTLQAQGVTVANTTGSLTVTLAGHQADDILVLGLIIWAPNTALPNNVIPTPSGWTLIGSQVGIGVLGEETGWLAWFWKRATSGAETNPVCSRGSGWDTGTDTCFGGRAYTIRGCITTGNPWDATASAGPYNTANQAFAAITVSGTERMAVQFGNSTDDAAFVMTSSGWTTGTEDNDPTGTDCDFQTARKDNISSSTSADTATVSAPAQGAYGYMGISFKPPASGQTISSAGAVASVEAFGTSKINLKMTVETAGSGESSGTPTVSFGLLAVTEPQQPVRISINR